MSALAIYTQSIINKWSMLNVFLRSAAFNTHWCISFFQKVSCCKSALRHQSLSLWWVHAWLLHYDLKEEKGVQHHPQMNRSGMCEALKHACSVNKSCQFSQTHVAVMLLVENNALLKDDITVKYKSSEVSRSCGWKTSPNHQPRDVALGFFAVSLRLNLWLNLLGRFSL